MDSQNLSLAHHIQTAAPDRHHCSNLFPNCFFSKLFEIHTSFRSSLLLLSNQLQPRVDGDVPRFRWDNWNLNLSATSSREALWLLADSESIIKCQVELEGAAWWRARRCCCWCAAFRRHMQLNEAVLKPQRRTKWPLNDFWLLHDPNLIL